jgi:hypothetical protein
LPIDTVLRHDDDRESALELLSPFFKSNPINKVIKDYDGFDKLSSAVFEGRVAGPAQRDAIFETAAAGLSI